MSRLGFLLLGMLGMAIAGGCSPYIDGYYYTPRPGTTQVVATQPSAGQPPAASAMATVIGVRYADDSAKLPETVEIRLQIEASDDVPVTVDPQSMQLTNAELMTFGQAVLNPPTPISLSPHQSAVLDILFPFPAGQNYQNTDLNTLTLRWTDNVNGQPVGQAIAFSRVWTHYYYYDDGPYYGPYWGPGFYGGVVIVHRHW